MRNHPVLRRAARFQSELAVLAIVLAVLVVFGVTVENYLSTAGLTSVLGRSVTVGILVVGLTLCLLVGEIDLSIGATMAFGGVVFASIQPDHGLVPAIVVALAAGLGVGAINALLVCVLGVNSFIATLGMLFVAQSAALVLSHGEPLAPTDIDASTTLTEPLLGPIDPRFVLFAAIVIVGQLFVSRTRWGRELIAVGGNSDAARGAGIPIGRRRALALMLSGTLASVAGIQLAIGLLSAAPATGDVELLTSVAAAFLAGVALTGGRGSIVAAGLAVLALSGLAAGLELAQIEAAYGQIILGGVIVVVGCIVGRHQLRDLVSPLIDRFARPQQ